MQNQPGVRVAFDEIDNVGGSAGAVHRDQHWPIVARLKYVGEDAQRVLACGAPIQADFPDDGESWEQRTESMGVVACAR